MEGLGLLLRGPALSSFLKKGTSFRKYVKAEVELPRTPCLRTSGNFLKAKFAQRVAPGKLEIGATVVIVREATPPPPTPRGARRMPWRSSSRSACREVVCRTPGRAGSSAIRWQA